MSDSESESSSDSSGEGLFSSKRYEGIVVETQPPSLLFTWMKWGLKEDKARSRFGDEIINKLRFGVWSQYCTVRLDKFGRRTYLINESAKIKKPPILDLYVSKPEDRKILEYRDAFDKFLYSEETKSDFVNVMGELISPLICNDEDIEIWKSNYEPVFNLLCDRIIKTSNPSLKYLPKALQKNFPWSDSLFPEYHAVLPNWTEVLKKMYMFLVDRLTGAGFVWSKIDGAVQRRIKQLNLNQFNYGKKLLLSKTAKPWAIKLASLESSGANILEFLHAKSAEADEPMKIYLLGNPTQCKKVIAHHLSKSEYTCLLDLNDTFLDDLIIVLKQKLIIFHREHALDEETITGIKLTDDDVFKSIGKDWVGRKNMQIRKAVFHIQEGVNRDSLAAICVHDDYPNLTEDEFNALRSRKLDEGLYGWRLPYVRYVVEKLGCDKRGQFMKMIRQSKSDTSRNFRSLIMPSLNLWEYFSEYLQPDEMPFKVLMSQVFFPCRNYFYSYYCEWPDLLILLFRGYISEKERKLIASALASFYTEVKSQDTPDYEYCMCIDPTFYMLYCSLSESFDVVLSTLRAAHPDFEIFGKEDFSFWNDLLDRNDVYGNFRHVTKSHFESLRQVVNETHEYLQENYDMLTMHFEGETELYPVLGKIFMYVGAECFRKLMSRNGSIESVLNYISKNLWKYDSLYCGMINDWWRWKQSLETNPELQEFEKTTAEFLAATPV